MFLATFRALPGPARGAVAAGAIVVAGTAGRFAAPADTDIAWLLTVGEHLLDGAVPYRDIIETNPPASVVLYLPAVLIGRATGIDPQAVVLLMTGLACAASLAFCAAILRPALPRALQGPLVAVAAAALALLPMGSFGQRDHLILAALLPLLSRWAVRGAAPGPAGALAGVAAGALAGCGLAIKPHYALGLLGPALSLRSRAGWRRALEQPDLWTAGAVAGALLAAQLALFPAFTHDVLPLLTRVYLPMRLPLLDLVRLPGGAAGLLALLGCALARRAGPAGPGRALGDTATLAALGFFAAYLLQGKGWPYQAYPAVAAALVGLGTRLAGRNGAVAPSRLRAGRLAAVALAGWAALGFDRHVDIEAEAPGLTAAVADLGPHPRVMSLASDIAVGHPLVRRVGGVWVGTLMSSWIDLYVDRIAPGEGRRGPLGPDLAFEDRVLASDIRDRHPDAVLADAPGWDRWIAGAPEVAAALLAYRAAGTYGAVMLWTPKVRNAPG